MVIGLNKVLLIIAFIMMIFALVVATGTAFLTGWNVWLCASGAAYLLAALVP
jgi:hypothetical protein